MTQDRSSDSHRVVTQALNFTPPERIPVFEGYIWPEFESRWRGERNMPETRRLADLYRLDLRTVRPLEVFFPSEVGEVSRSGKDRYTNDGWGRIVRTVEGAGFSEVVEQLHSTPGDIESCRFDPPGLDMRFDSGFGDAVEESRGRGVPVFVSTGGPFLRSAFLRGETQFLMDLIADEPLARMIVEKTTTHLIGVGLEALSRANAYDYGIWIYDDMCDSRSPLFSPAIFERIFLPAYRRMVEAYRAVGARWIILHCDGNLLPILDQLIEAGIDGINPVEHAAGLDVAALRHRYERLRLIGGVCNTRILPSGDPETIRRHVESIVEVARDGGVIVGTHSVGPEVPVENYELYRSIINRSRS